MLHVTDSHISKVGTPDRHCPPDGGLVRSVQRNLCRCGGDRFCSVAAWPSFGPHSVGSRSAVGPRNRAPLSSWPWAGASDTADADFTPCRRADRRRRRVALQGAFRRDCGNLGRPSCTEFHCNQTSGAEGRGGRRSLLADPAWRHRQSERGAGPLAHCLAALDARPRRCKITRQSPLAAGVVPLARQTARHLDGTA